MKSVCKLKVHRLDDHVSNIVRFFFSFLTRAMYCGDLGRMKIWGLMAGPPLSRCLHQRRHGRVNWSGCWWQFQTCLTSRTRQNDRRRCQVENWASGIVSTDIIRERHHCKYLTKVKNTSETASSFPSVKSKALTVSTCWSCLLSPWLGLSQARPRNIDLCPDKVLSYKVTKQTQWTNQSQSLLENKMFRKSWDITLHPEPRDKCNQWTSKSGNSGTRTEERESGLG